MLYEWTDMLDDCGQTVFNFVGVRHGRDIHINTAYDLLLAYTYIYSISVR